MNEVEQLVIEVVADVLGRNTEAVVCRDDHLADDLGVDELDLTNIVCEIETRAGIELPTGAENAVTVADLIAAARQARDAGPSEHDAAPSAARSEGSGRRRRGGRRRRRTELPQ